MALGELILTDAGSQALSDAHTQETTVTPAFFKVAEVSTPYESGGNLDPSVTDLDDGSYPAHYTNQITGYQQVDANTVQFRTEVPVDRATTQFGIVGLYLIPDTTDATESGTLSFTADGTSITGFSGMTTNEYQGWTLHYNGGDASFNNNYGFYTVQSNTADTIVVDRPANVAESGAISLDLYDIANCTLYLLAKPPSPIPTDTRQVMINQLNWADVISVVDFTYVLTNTWLDLTDTYETSYSGKANYRPKVRGTADGLELVDDTLENLEDVPDFSGNANEFLKVSATENGIEYGFPSILSLTDCDETSFTSQGGYLFRVNTGATGFEFVDPNTILGVAVKRVFTLRLYGTVNSTGTKEPTIYSEFGGTIKKIRTRCSSGSGDVHLYKNGTSLSGPHAISSTGAEYGSLSLSMADDDYFNVYVSTVTTDMTGIIVQVYYDITSADF